MSEGTALILFVGAIILLVRKRPCRTSWLEDMEWHMNEYIHQVHQIRADYTQAEEDQDV